MKNHKKITKIGTKELCRHFALLSSLQSTFPVIIRPTPQEVLRSIETIETGSMSGKMLAEIPLFWLRHMVDSMSQRLCKHPEPAASNSRTMVLSLLYNFYVQVLLLKLVQLPPLPRSIKTTLHKTISTAMVYLHAVFLCFTRILSLSTEMFA